MSQPTFTISTFAHARDNRPQAVPTTFDALCEWFSRPMQVPGKESAPLWSPAEYPPQATRGKSNVFRVHVGVLDFDGVPQLDLERVLGPRLAGLDYLIHPTFSHYGQTIPLWRFRLLVPLSRPVPRDEWPAFWQKLALYFGVEADPKDKDASRIYYVPSCPVGAAPIASMRQVEGQRAAFDVDALMARPMASLQRPRLTTAALTKEAERLAAHADEYPRSISGPMMALALGQAVAQAGNRDDALFHLTGALARAFAGATREDFLAVLHPSWQKMHQADPEGCPTWERVESMVDRQMASQAQRATERETGAASLALAELREAGRETAYSPAELEEWARRAGDCSPAEFRRRWIIRHRDDFYVFHEGQYRGPVGVGAIRGYAGRLLAPISELPGSSPAEGGIRIREPGRNQREGSLWPVVGLDELMEICGNYAETVTYDLSARWSRFDLARRELVVAPCPVRAIEPRYDAEIARWLELLAGDADTHARLLDWLAASPMLDRPSCALYVCGHPGAGKSLLAHGVARIWADAPTQLHGIIGERAWNDPLLRCPLVLADETVPKDRRGNTMTGELREFISSVSRPLTRKYHAHAEIHGAVRLIIAANNAHLINDAGDLALDDVRAIAGRFLRVLAGKAAAEYLASLPRETIDGWAREGIAAHAIALHQAHVQGVRPIASGGRFAVDGNGAAMARELSTSGGLRSAVCQWLVEWCTRSAGAESMAAGPDRPLLTEDKDGAPAVAINARILQKLWTVHMSHEKEPPGIGALGRALAAVADGAQRRLGTRSARASYYVVTLAKLQAWAEDQGWAFPARADEVIDDAQPAA